MEKKEYQSPKMEIVNMPALGNLLEDSGHIPIECVGECPEDSQE